MLNYQTLHLLSLPTRYYFEKNKSGFDVYKSVNFFPFFFLLLPVEPRITPITQWMVKNKFLIDHNDTIPLTKLSWPSNQQNSKHWRKLTSLILLRDFMKVKKKKKCSIIDTIFSQRYFLYKMDIWPILIDKTQFLWYILTILFLLKIISVWRQLRIVFGLF